MSAWVYMLQCEDGSYYTGWSTDPVKRFSRHRSGRGAKYTRSHRPVAIVYAECFGEKREAMRAEYRIKHLSRSMKEKLVLTVPHLADGTVNFEIIKRREKMKDLKFYRCRKCGKIIVTVHDAPVPTMCCGEPMELLNANTTDAATEKHVPVIVREDGVLYAIVGSTEHPMTPEHYIEFIALQTAKGFRIVWLEPGEAPKAEILKDENVTAVYAYCNLHGLWKTEA